MFAAAKCGRRAGKSHTASKDLLITCLKYPDTMSCYLSLTRKSSKRIMWKTLKKEAREFDVPCEFKESELIVQFHNGSELHLLGVKDEGVAESLRGNAYKKVYLDECASFKSEAMEYLIEEVIVPALADHKGVLRLIGTPGFDLNSYFYKATTDSALEYKVHHWNFLQNPHIPDARGFLDQLMRRRGYTEDHPIVQREFFGNWVKDDSLNVYKYNPFRNTFDSLPHTFTDYVIGLDLGFEDATAMVVLACNRKSRFVYEVFADKWSGLLPCDIASKLQKLSSQYNQPIIICDEGGLGKSIAEEFRLRYGLNVKAAQKRDKRAYIEITNSELLAGSIKVSETSKTASEWTKLIWDEDRLLELEGLDNHCADAFLYAFRYIKNYIFTEDPLVHERNTEAWYKQEEQRLIESWKEQHEPKEEDYLFGYD